MNKIDITVYITSFNRPGYLLESVESVERQGICAKNIIVLDNNSVLSAAMISVKNQLKKRVTWKGSDTNNGSWWNFERAFLNCQTQFMMVLHDDDHLLECFLHSQSLILISNPLISALSCNGFKIDCTGARFGDHLIKYKHSAVKYFNNSCQVGLHVFGDSCIPPSPMIYRVSAVKKLVLNLKVDQEKFNQTIDVALMMVIADDGCLALNMEPLYKCRIHENQDSANMLLDGERYLREFSMKYLNGNKSELRMVKKALKSNYTYGILYSITRLILELNLTDIRNTFKDIELEYFSLGGVIVFANVVIRKVKSRFRKFLLKT